MSAALKEREELARAEAELTEAEAGIEAAQAKFLETGEEREAKAIRAARDRAELAELRVQRCKTILARAEEAATVAATEARRRKHAQDRATIDALLAKESPLIDAEAKLLLQLVDIRVARRNIRSEAHALVQDWLPLYLEFSPPFEVSEYCRDRVTEGTASHIDALKWTNPAAFGQDPWLHFAVIPPAQPVIDAARSAGKFIDQAGKADPRAALLDRVLPSPGDYQLPTPPKVNGIYLDWIPTTDVPPLVEKKSLLGGLLK